MKMTISPKLEDIKLECVLIQAWKKASSYIRYHNWYADTLDLDYQSLRLPQFISELQKKLENGWHTTPLKVVPAPKSQKWEIGTDNKWKKKKNENISKKIRPLAHVSLEDQVISTAIMLCFADYVETLQGNPELNITDAINRGKVISYGNRLFCDYNNEENARHRWGSKTVYRKYFTDYQTFLRRPEIVTNEIRENKLADNLEIVVIHSDLSKFYDRVRPDQLHMKIKKHSSEETQKNLLCLTESVFNWTWHDEDWANNYAKTSEIDGYENIALPQGLVASGFFANLFLLDFDESLKCCFNKRIKDGVTLIDACRYVDDLRLVLTVPEATNEKCLQKYVTDWLMSKLKEKANGLIIEESKTKVIFSGREDNYIIPMSKSARRIQHDISGTIDMLHGTELIGAIEGFFYTQKRYSQEQLQVNGHGLIKCITDMRDDTASRFAAGKFRRTFRSLRPLLDDENIEPAKRHAPKLILSRQQLDERGKLFAAQLIEEWVSNPANVRLLRVALDLYPDKEILDKILKNLEDGWDIGGCNSQQREVKLYCLSEIFRAGATETGLVKDDECLPASICLEKYHQRLIEEAEKILKSDSSKNRKRCPWYLMQQIYLYLIAKKNIIIIQIPQISRNNMLNLYYRFANFLKKKYEKKIEQRSVLTALAFQAFGYDKFLSTKNISPKFLKCLTLTSPVAALHLDKLICGEMHPDIEDDAKKIGLKIEPSKENKALLPQIASRALNPFWDEANLLKYASDIAEKIKEDWLNPWQIECEFENLSEVNSHQIPKLKKVSISTENKRATELFSPPAWAETEDDKKRFLLGMLMRFALRGSIDFTSNMIYRNYDSVKKYMRPGSHWLQLHYGGYHGRTAFAPAWVALSSWLEDFLFELFRWPGCGEEKPWSWEEIDNYLKDRSKIIDEELRGASTNILFLEQCANIPRKQQSVKSRKLRVGVVQSILPTEQDFNDNKEDPQLNNVNFRKRHRQHLAALIQGINQMLHIRRTHLDLTEGEETVLDLLVFPELAIHPDDIDSMLLPFVRKHRCIIITGLVYHPQRAGSDKTLINTALWIIPEINKMAGLAIKKIEQGKFHISKEEKSLVPKPVPFRPAQWIIQYEWSLENKPPLSLSASVCYDSTDIALCSDLRSRTDLYCVCALNKDVGTFDRMAVSMHYHMYQGILVVNNGEFGGSNCYIPFKNREKRQVLHLHGQPQAQIAFLEIDPQNMNNRKMCDDWKTPPAGWCESRQSYSDL